MNEITPEQQIDKTLDELLSSSEIPEIIRAIAREEATKQPRNFDEGDKSAARFFVSQGYAGI